MPVEESFFKEAEERMKKSIESLSRDLSGVRTGRAAPTILDKVVVEAYGSDMPLSQMASISVPEARMLVVQPYDKSQISAIERAIHKSDLGINPSNDGQVIRLSFPPLTQDRRKDLVKVVKKRGEETKVAVRNVRRDLLEELKKLKDLREDETEKAKERLQKITDKIVAEISHALDSKEREILEV